MHQRAEPGWERWPRSALRRVPRWTSWLPAVFVCLYLILLAFAFLWLGERIRDRQAIILETIRPARSRLVQIQRTLALGLAAEGAYAVHPDPRFASAFLVADARLRELERELAGFAGRPGGAVALELARFVVARERWAAAPRALMRGELALDAYRAGLVDHQDVIHEATTAAARLEAAFDTHASQLMSQIQDIQRLRRSLMGVAGLIALIASIVAAVFGERSRRLTEALALRAEQESGLRKIAANLTATEDLPAALKRIAEAARATVGGRGAFIESVQEEDGTVAVLAAAGSGVPARGARTAYAGSPTEAVVESRSSWLAADLGEEDCGWSARVGETGGPCPAVILPLRHNATVQGALVVALRPGSVAARYAARGALKRLRILANLTALALWRDALFRREQKAREGVAKLLESVTDAFVAVDREGRFTYVNGKAEELSGMRREELLGQQVSAVFTEGSVAELGRAIERALREREATSFETSEPVLGCWLEGVAYPARDGAATAFFRDVSDRKRAELGRQRLERGLRLLGKAGRELASSLDYEATLRSVVRLVVPQLADWCTVHVAEPGERRARAIETAHADPSKRLLVEELTRRFPMGLDALQPIAAVIRSGEPRFNPEVDVEALRRAIPDPEIRELVLRLGVRSGMVLPLRAGGKVLGALALATAESGRRYDREDFELAQELAQRAALAVHNALLYRKAQQALRARDEVLAIVSHDLRNPLHTVEMTAELLAELRPEPEQQVVHLEAILRATRQMSRLIQDLLDVSRIQAGKPLSIEARAEPPARLVREAAEAFEAAAREKRIRLEVDADADLPLVYADAERVHQVLANLLSNAVKFTPEGGAVRVGVQREAECVRFWVQDSGPGIAREDLEHIFEPFWQVHPAARLGTGLGLAIARGIVEQHGGSIRAESERGVGSTFVFTLPLARRQPRAGRAA